MRQIMNFNTKWAFSKEANEVPKTMPERWYWVNLPHTWNPRRKRQRMGRRNIRRHTVECFPKIMKWRTLNHGSKKLKESQVG